MVLLRRRALVAVAVVLAAGAAGFLIARGGHKPNATASRADGQQLLRARRLRQARARTRALERTRARLERKVAAQTKSGAGSGGAPATGAAKTSFGKLAASLGGKVGVAYGPARAGASATVLGDWSTGPAWSTIKAPLSIAAVRDAGGRPSAATEALMRRAVTASDNAAAEAIWSSLGPPATAGRKVGAVLSDAGDTSTVVQTRKVRSQFSPFGQTIWSVAAQQRFAAALPCLRDSDPVLALMGQVVGDQRWGLGQAGSNQRFKGGWGPDPGGAYDVRQFGLIDPPSGGTLAVALAAHPADGSFDTGKTMLNRLAAWVAEHGKGGSTGC